ncbi:small multi-drug export protein [Flavisolibacter sp. BT320]|nr:small multi-drug export protein [Flavisolibacter longurius]
MLEILLYTFLFSISPFGEARVGIPYAVFNNVHYLLAFSVGLLGNILIYPLFMWLIDRFHQKLWPYTRYKKGTLWFARIAKKSAGDNIRKYGFWGLMVFVMIPLPGTGAYSGTIAAALFKIERRKAFLAITIGTLISCVIMAAGSYFSALGISLLK